MNYTNMTFQEISEMCKSMSTANYVEPCGPLTEPCYSITEPCDSITEPCEPIPEPCEEIPEPCEFMEVLSSNPQEASNSSDELPGVCPHSRRTSAGKNSGGPRGWRITRSPNEPWAIAVSSKNERASISELAAKLGLDASEAHGANGWLKQDIDGRIVDTSPAIDTDGGSFPYYVPNTFVVKNGAGLKNGAPITSSKTIEILKAKKFYVKEDWDNTSNVSVCGTVLIGHFWKGIFSPNNGTSQGATFDAFALKDLVGHKISYFAGYGCFTDRGNWNSIVEKKEKAWLTNYYLTFFFKDPKMKIDIDIDTNINIDLHQSKNSLANLEQEELDSMLKRKRADASALRAYQPGNSGLTLSEWLKQITD